MATDSEASPDNSERALDVKAQFRQGKIGRAEFVRTMYELRRSGKDRVEPRRRTVAGTNAGLSVLTASSRSLATDAWLRRDTTIAEGRGGGGGVSQESGSTSSKQRHGNTSGMLVKLGERLAAGLATASLKIDQASGGGGSGQGGSPAPDGARSDGGRRRKSNRRGFDSPHDQDAALEISGGSERRPWSVPSNAGRTVRRIFSGPSSPERLVPSPGGTPVRGGDSVGEGRQSPTHYPGRAEHGARGSIGDAGGGGRGAGSVSSAGGPPPLTASEIDNMSSISNTSTVLTDLSVRLEKIEDMLARLLDAQKPPRGSGGGDVGGGGGAGGGGGGAGVGGGDFESLPRQQGRLRTLAVQQVERGAGTSPTRVSTLLL